MRGVLGGQGNSKAATGKNAEIACWLFVWSLAAILAAIALRLAGVQ